MKKVYLSKKKRPVSKTQSRLDILKNKRLKKINSNSKINKQKLKKKLKKIGLIFLSIILMVSTIGGLVTLAYLQDLNDKIPSPDNIFGDLPVASEIYDRKAIEGEPGDGTRLWRLFDKYNSDILDISEVPNHVKLAFIAAEDSEFYVHGGFDPSAILRCGINYIRNSSSLCGGSTITQQVVKLRTNKIEVAVERKINEILYAVKVEQSYSKDEILEMYLRITPFGSSIVGVKTAANFYFGKEPKDLTLAEAAVLAAIIQDPVRLSPTLSKSEDVFCRKSDGTIIANQDVQDPDSNPTDIFGNELVKGSRVRCRQLYVLKQMEEKADKFNNDLRMYYDDPEMDSILTQELIEEARDEDWESRLRPPVFDKKAGHFVNYVMEQLTTRNYKNGSEPFTLTDLQTGGYKIYTTLDYDIQQIAERYAQRAGTEYSFWNVNNAALMTTIPGTGQIIAMAGSKSFYGTKEGCDANNQNCKYDPEVNVLTSLQEPGSSNKPLGYYLAFKDGKLFTGSFLPDIPIRLGSGYEPRNWDNSFKGVNYTAEQAIRDSRNIPAIEVIDLVGVENYISTAQQFGYTSFTGDLGHSAILGGVSVYPIEHAQGYGVFANGGDLVMLDPILKIVDKDGNTVYEAKPERRSVGDPQGIYLLNQAIKNYDGYSWDGRDLAGKTGTTQDNWDAWMMAYSPDFVNVCWVGNNNNSPMDPNFGYPPYVIKPWCQDYLREIGESPYLSPKTPFPRPAGVYEGGGDCNESGCLGLSRGWLIEGRTPPRDVNKAKAVVCTDQEDRLARPVDIAMGLSKEKDFTQYLMPVAAWQHFLDEYMGQKNAEKPGEFNKNGIPTEYCDIDRSGGVTGPYFPTLSASVSQTNINIKGNVFTTSGNINGLTFEIKNQTGDFMAIPGCTTTNYNGFDITCNLSSLGIDSGNATLRARATDSTGKANTKNVTVSVPSGFSFTSPSGELTCSIAAGNCPTTISVTYAGGWTLNPGSVVFLFSKDGAGDVVVPGAVSSAGSSHTISWNILATGGAGEYRFRARATTSTGGDLVSGDSSTVTVKNP